MASAFFTAFNGSSTQLYKLGADQSVTQWTALNTGPGHGLTGPPDLTEFDGNVWFNGDTSFGTQGRQLFKLGFDGSVTQWTAINPGVQGLDPFDLTDFNDALWCDAGTPTQGFQLLKWGNDGSVTQWTALNTGVIGLAPFNLTDFNNAMWFDGLTPNQGIQLFKLGNDGSVTQWTAINPGG